MPLYFIIILDMKKQILPIFILIASLSINAQDNKVDIDTLTFTKANEDEDFYRKISNGTTIGTYIYEDGYTVSIGNKFILNEPSDSNLTNNSEYALNSSGSAYSSIFVGEFSTGNSILMGVPTNYPISKDLEVEITKIKLMHAGGRKKPVVPIFIFGRNSRKVLGTVFDIKGSLKLNEIIDPNAPMTRVEAISILKESKELLDLEMMTQEEYDKLKNELSPIIRKTE